MVVVALPYASRLPVTRVMFLTSFTLSGSLKSTSTLPFVALNSTGLPFSSVSVIPLTFTPTTFVPTTLSPSPSTRFASIDTVRLSIVTLSTTNEMLSSLSMLKLDVLRTS